MLENQLEGGEEKQAGEQTVEKIGEMGGGNERLESKTDYFCRNFMKVLST